MREEALALDVKNVPAIKRKRTSIDEFLVNLFITLYYYTIKYEVFFGVCQGFLESFAVFAYPDGDKDN